jgi:Tfp pilus assembly PilM family ATPase
MTTRGPVRWRQREASRAIRAAEQAGLTVSVVEVTPNGTIRVLTQQDKQNEAALAFDAWKDKHNARLA